MIFETMVQKDERYRGSITLDDLVHLKIHKHPPVIEIGSGNGHFLVEQAEVYPNVVFIGCETKSSRVQKTLSKIHHSQARNAFVFMGKAQELLSHFHNGSIRGIHINFPDPWEKKRYHKRRFFYMQKDVETLSEKLQEGAFISFISDHEEYFQHVFSLFSYSSQLTCAWEEGYRKSLDMNINTIFSQRWKQRGRNFFQTLFKKLQK